MSEIERIKKKFFVGHGNDQIFLKWGEIAMKLAMNWLKNPEKYKIHADITPPELAKIFDDVVLPEEGSKIEDVFNECQEHILKNSVRVNNPRFIGHMTSVTPWFSVVVDILITSINQNQVKIETALASTFIERQTTAWLHRAIYAKSQSYYRSAIQDEKVTLGNITNGGTTGILTALTVAREKCLPGCYKKGLLQVLKSKDYDDIAIIVSDRGHYSIRKSAAILGLGQQSMRKVPVDDKNRMDLKVLKKVIKQCRLSKTLVLALVGIAGTTETGNIDQIEAMADIAAKENIWFHVDAAWGGAFLLSPEFRKMFKGISKADSVTVDGHKLLYLPLSHGAVLFKNDKSLDLIRHHSKYIIREGSVDLGQTTIEGSRRFNSLKLWFSLKMLGVNGYTALFKKAVQLTEEMKNIVDADPDFERTNDPEICIVTYRYVPQKIQEELKTAVHLGHDQKVSEINLNLNKLNKDIQKRQRESGISFVSRTTLKFSFYNEEIVVFRSVLFNLLTKTEYLKEILQEQKTLGKKLSTDYELAISV